MEKIEHAEIIIDNYLSELTEQINVLQQVKLLLNSQALKGINTLPNNLLNNGNKNFNPLLFKDYPMEGKFTEKMLYLDNIIQQAWRLPERRDLIIQIEGEERAKNTLDGITGKLQNLRRRGNWITAKYGNINKFSFYLRPEWRTEDGKDIKAAFAPPKEILQKLPEEKRNANNIIWLLK